MIIIIFSKKKNYNKRKFVNEITYIVHFKFLYISVRFWVQKLHKDIPFKNISTVSYSIIHEEYIRRFHFFFPLKKKENEIIIT
jgi:hypothetical protein